MSRVRLWQFLFAAGALLVAPLAGEAQQPGKVPRVGYLMFQSPAAAGFFIEAFRQGLRDLGYVEGKNIVVEYRFAGGSSDRAAEMAAELVRLKVDLIVAAATPAAHAAKNATRTIPIVITSADPVGTGLVASLARPGGNITGLSMMLPDIAGKRLELLREVLPDVTRVAVLAHGADPYHRRFLDETQLASQKIGIQIQPVVVKGPEEFEGAFSAMIKERAAALVVHPIFTVTGHSRRIVDLAEKNRLPTVSDFREFTDAGALLSYGPNRREAARRSATYVDKILKGAKVADLPLEQPTKFELIINLKAAKALGLAIPQSMLLRADEVIQ